MYHYLHHHRWSLLWSSPVKELSVGVLQMVPYTSGEHRNQGRHRNDNPDVQTIVRDAHSVNEPINLF